MRKIGKKVEAMALVAALVLSSTPVNLTKVHAEEKVVGTETDVSLDEGEAVATEDTIKVDEAHFPDAVFRNYLISEYDSDGDGYINPSEVIYIVVYNMGVSSLKGIEYFTELTYLECEDNNLSSLDISRNTKLAYLECQNNNLSSLDVSKNTNLWMLSFDYDKISEIDLSNFTGGQLWLYFESLPRTGTLNLTKIKGCSVVKDIGAINYSIDEGDDSWVINTKEMLLVITSDHFEDDPISSPTATGIYHVSQTRDGILAGLVTENIDKSQLEYSWYVCNDGVNWKMVQDWTKGNEWLSYKPDDFGDYVLVGKARYTENGKTKIIESSSYFSYHPEIKGMCQMPYEGEGGGFLIGVESYDNPGQAYSYELLVLDCALLAEGKDAWIYTTNRCGVAVGSAFWTVWQPQYGYYWTLFRVYDADGNMIDETCYGFQNI